MSTLLLTHPDCLAHDPGPGHPEYPGRLKAVLERLQSDFPDLPRATASRASDEMLLRAHSPELLQELERLAPPPRGESESALEPDQWVRIDADTVMSRASLGAARAACGAVVDGVEAVFSGAHRNAFCAVRPPGHHAERRTAMGFCLFNGVAVGALAALASGRCQRVAIADFDVHHGNGTQDIFADDPRVLFLSTHQMPLYPGTGGRDSTGVGNVVNVPLLSGAGGREFRAAVEAEWLPALAEFNPELVLVSAGFDAHADDPLAGLRLTEEDYRWVTRQLTRVADNCCRGRLVSSLEGGYDPAALAASVSAHVSVLAAAS